MTFVMQPLMAVGARLTAGIHFLNVNFDPAALFILVVISWMEI
jgi:hypothetical protein